MSEQIVDVCARFNHLAWHDSEVRGIHIDYSEPSEGGASYDVILFVKLIVPGTSGKEQFKRVQINFLEVRLFQSDLDLLGTRYCGGDISSAKCSDKSQFLSDFAERKIAEFDLPQSDDPLRNLKHFQIYLCPPSGAINIVAAGFEMVQLDG